MEYIYIIILFIIYFIPSIAARNHRNFTSIFILNLLLGWVIIGWIVALIWAFSRDRKEIIIHNSSIKKSTSDELKELKELYDNGVITKEEFEEGKKQLFKK